LTVTAFPTESIASGGRGSRDGRPLQSRGRSLGCAILLLVLLVLTSNLFVPSSIHAETVSVSIEPIADPEVDQALIAGVNLPTLFSAEAALDPSSEAWSTALATEQNRLTAVLRSFGYLAGRVELVETPAPTEVHFRPVPGPLYRIAVIQITGVSGLGGAQDQAEIQRLVSTAIGEAPRGDILTRMAGSALWQVRNLSYPYARVLESELEADAATATASVRLAIEPGPEVKLGEVTYYGAREIDAQHLARLQPISIGDPYSPEAMEAFRLVLEDLPLVRSARVDIAEEVDASGRVPVRVMIVEREDPARLGHLKLAGIAALVSALAAIAVRQAVQTGYRGQRPLLHGHLNLAVLVLLIVVLALVVERAIKFSG
jgi:outer membrane translocation and assembly module TamA